MPTQHPHHATTERLSVSIDTAAELHNVSTKTIRRAIERGDLPAYRIGRAIRIKATDLDRIMKPIKVYRGGDAA